MEELLRSRRWLYDAFAGLFALFGAFSLLLTLAGLYATICAAARRRIREHGVRLALGAAPSMLRAAVLKASLRPLTLGIGWGLIVAIPVARRLDTLLFEMSAGDPGVFLATGALLWVCGVVAVLQPAIEASRVDPKSALNSL